MCCAGNLRRRAAKGPQNRFRKPSWLHPDNSLVLRDMCADALHGFRPGDFLVGSGRLQVSSKECVL
jgi:hypothetical protein